MPQETGLSSGGELERQQETEENSLEIYKWWEESFDADKFFDSVVRNYRQDLNMMDEEWARSLSRPDLRKTYKKAEEVVDSDSNDSNISQRDMFEAMLNAQLSVLIEKVTVSIVEEKPMTIKEFGHFLEDIVIKPETREGFLNRYTTVLERIDESQEIVSREEKIEDILKRYQENNQRDELARTILSFEEIRKLHQEGKIANKPEDFFVTKKGSLDDIIFIFPGDRYKVTDQEVIETLPKGTYKVTYHNPNESSEFLKTRTVDDVDQIPHGCQMGTATFSFPLFDSGNDASLDNRPDTNGRRRIDVRLPVFKKSFEEEETVAKGYQLEDNLKHELRHHVFRFLFPDKMATEAKLFPKSTDSSDSLKDYISWLEITIIDEIVAGFTNARPESVYSSNRYIGNILEVIDYTSRDKGNEEKDKYKKAANEVVDRWQPLFSKIEELRKKIGEPVEGKEEVYLVDWENYRDLQMLSYHFISTARTPEEMEK
ncbi:hypothetical protein KKC60_05085, partial [Patescibacteria group bacterium]|nr:hypothetical protein [Patescibacteria group bacterium]